jgi:hypothetical protein
MGGTAPQKVAAGDEESGEIFIALKLNAEFGGIELDVLAGESGLLNASLNDLVLSFRQHTDDALSLSCSLASFLGIRVCSMQCHAALNLSLLLFG